MRLHFPVNPVLPSPEAEWAAATFRPRSALEAVSWDSVRSEWKGVACTAPWDVPVRVGDDSAPGGLSLEFPFWRDVLLNDHPDRTTILTWIRDGVSVYEFLVPGARGLSVEQPFNPAVFTGEKLPNRVPNEFREFVAGEVATIVRRGCLVPFEEVRTNDGPSRPRLIYATECRPVEAAPHLRCTPPKRSMSARLLRLGFSGFSRHIGAGGVLSRITRGQVRFPSCPFTPSIVVLVWGSVGGYRVRMDGFAVWLERESVCLPNRLRCEKPVVTGTRYSGLYIHRRLVAVLPGCGS